MQQERRRLIRQINQMTQVRRKPKTNKATLSLHGRRMRWLLWPGGICQAMAGKNERNRATTRWW